MDAVDRERRDRVYAHFEVRGFEPTPRAIALIVVATEEHPDVVVALWRMFNQEAQRHTTPPSSAGLH